MPVGLGKRELRDPSAVATLTGAEFNYLLANRGELPTCSEEVQKAFAQTELWLKRHNSSMKAVATKRKKYKTWPGGRKK